MTERGHSDEDVIGSASGTVRAEIDWAEVSPSTAVAETVVIASEREPTGLEPLYKSIDRDALDTLIRSMETVSTDGDATVTFALDGYNETVHPVGTVDVGPNSERTDSS